MFKRVCFAIAASIALPACASLPESVTTRQAVSALAVPQDYRVKPLGASRIVDDLMELFADEWLETLVQTAVGRNLDIRLAAKQLEEAGFVAGARRGQLFPNLTGGIATDRVKAVDERSASTFSPALDVSWEVDIWGRLRDETASLDASAAARREDLRAAQDSIASQAMQGWFDIVTAEKQVALERSRLDNFRKIAADSRRSYRAGLASLDDLAVIERDIA